MHSTGKDPVYMPGGRALDGLIAFDPNGRVTTGVFSKVYWTEQNPGAVLTPGSNQWSSRKIEICF